MLEEFKFFISYGSIEIQEFDVSKSTFSSIYNLFLVYEGSLKFYDFKLYNNTFFGAQGLRSAIV